MVEVLSGYSEDYSMPDLLADVWSKTVDRAGVIAETGNEDVIVELVVNESKFVINYSIDVFPVKGSLSNNPNARQRILIEASRTKAVVND